MNTGEASSTHAVIVETELQFSLLELSRICGADITVLEALVEEGVLMPRNTHSTQWAFDGAVLPRARRATRLLRDMELNASGAALVLDLLDEIQTLKSQLRHLRG